MLDRRAVGGSFRQRFPVKSAFEDGLYGAIRERIDLQGTAAGRFKAGFAIGFAESQDPQQRAIGLLRMRPIDQQGFQLKLQCFVCFAGFFEH